MNMLKNALLIVSLLSANVLANSQNLVNLFVGSYGTVAKEGIKWYQFNEDTGEYRYISGVTGVQNASFQTLSPDGKWLYSVSENAADQGQLVSYNIDYDAHKLTEISRDLTLGDGIAIMSVDAATGTIANVGYQPTGTHPRNFNITPNGKFLLCACRDTNSIQIFARDIADGTLTLTGTIATPRPVALIFSTEIK
jgi:6-phosphogluconolactonase (cycloisomerase 2 family)